MRANVDPRIWGPSAWKFLEHCAEAIDEKSIDSFRRLVDLLPDVLPCEACREHSAKYIATHPLSGNDVKSWLKDFKSAVSLRKASSCSRTSPKSSYPLLSMFLAIIAAATALALLLVLLANLTKADS